jgi:4-aminobutyrate aminotransferase-like enzyme
VRLMPPLVVDSAAIDEALGLLERSLIEALAAEPPH